MRRKRWRATVERKRRERRLAAFGAAMLKPRRVVFPLFEIASNPTISLAALAGRRFGIYDGEPPEPEILAPEPELTGWDDWLFPTERADVQA